MKKLNIKISEKTKYSLLSFFAPAAILLLAYFINGLFPFGNRSIFTLDLASQYVQYFGELRDALFTDESIIYSYSRTLGGEFLGMVAYYLASPLSLIVVLLPEKWICFSVTVLILIKTGLCGLFMNLYLTKGKALPYLESLLFSVMYALCGYVVVYGSNIMWLDGVFILPLIALGIEKLAQNGKMFLFTAALAYALYSNYYIGYMLCIFSVLYLLLCFFTKDGQDFSIKSFGAFFGKGALGALIAAACACVMLLPGYYSLSFGKDQFSTPDFALKPLSDFLTTLSKLFPASYDSVEFESSAYIYCGVLTLICAPLYFCLKSVSVKKKIGFGALIFILAASLSLSSPDLFWHGFQAPNWLNHRYSFILCFILCSMGAETFSKRAELSRKTFYGAGVFIFLLLAQLQVSNIESFDPLTTLWVSILLTALYVVLICAFESTRFKRALPAALAVVVCLELLYSSAFSIHKYGANMRYTIAGVIENDTAKYAPAADAINTADSGLFRTEIYGDRRYNNSFSVNINGLSSSTSTADTGVTEIIKKLGYVSYSIKTQYVTVNPAADSLLGVKYVISEKPLDNGIHEHTDIYSENGLTVYKNPCALPFAFMSCDDIKDLDLSEYISPLDAINAVYSAVSSNANRVFSPLAVKSVAMQSVRYSSGDGIITYEATSNNDEKAITFTINVPEGDEAYCYLPAPYRKAYKVFADEREIGTFGESESYTVIPLGKAESSKMTVKIVWTEGDMWLYPAPNYFYSFNPESFKTICAELNDGGLNVTAHSDTLIKGTLSASSNGTLFLSLPYDENFKITVDGKETETFEVLGALTGISVSAGKHDIEIKYVPIQFYTGIALSCAGIISLAAVYLTEKYGICRIRKFCKKDNV